MESKTVLDSGFHAVDSGFRIPGTWILDSMSVKFGFPIPVVTEWDSGFRIPNSRILDSRSKNVPDSLTWGETFDFE